LGHKIVVLSRRPGKIKKIVEIDIDLKDRKNHILELNKKQDELWELMKEEALVAEQELINVS